MMLQAAKLGVHCENLKVLLLAGVKVSYGLFLFFFNDTATTEIYTLSLHDALPISSIAIDPIVYDQFSRFGLRQKRLLEELVAHPEGMNRSEEHTSELQSRPHLVCRLLLEKKKYRRSCIT